MTGHTATNPISPMNIPATIHRRHGIWRWVVTTDVEATHTGWALTRRRAERAARREWGIRRP